MGRGVASMWWPPPTREEIGVGYAGAFRLKGAGVARGSNGGMNDSCVVGPESLATMSISRLGPQENPMNEEGASKDLVDERSTDGVRRIDLRPGVFWAREP
jgi:hypothetical protein